MNKSDFSKQINDVNLELDQFHEFLKQSPVTTPKQNTSQIQSTYRSPIYRVSPPTNQYSSSKFSNYYLSPKSTSNLQRTPSPKTSNSTTDDEIDAIIRCEREKSGTISPFKKYQFKKNISFSSPSQDENKSLDDNLNLSNSPNSNSEGSQTNSPTSLYLTQTDEKEMKRIIKAIHLIDKVNKKKQNETKKKYEDYSNSGVQLAISKSFAVPYTGSYEDEIVVKIEDSDEEIDSDLEEFNNIKPPIPDVLSDDEKNQNNDINEIHEPDLTKVNLQFSDEDQFSSSLNESSNPTND